MSQHNSLKQNRREATRHVSQDQTRNNTLTINFEGKSRDQSANDKSGHSRKQSVDSKSLVAMMSKINQLKNTEEGKTKLFQKLTKHKKQNQKIDSFVQIIDILKEQTFSKEAAVNHSSISNQQKVDLIISSDIDRKPQLAEFAMNLNKVKQ